MNSVEIVKRHIANIAEPISEQDHSIYSDKLVSEFPNAPEGHTSRLEGPAALGRFLAAIGSFAPERRVDEVEVFDAGEDVVALFRSNFRVKDSGRSCSMPMILILQMEGGQIVRLREYYDPLKVLRAFGELPEA